jgi:hypothetical protein
VELVAGLEADAPPAEWHVPQGCYDVGPIVREYLEDLIR